MRNDTTLRLAVLVIALVPLFAWAGCGGNEEGKIPVTTSSDNARAEFEKGRSLFEKLSQF